MVQMSLPPLTPTPYSTPVIYNPFTYLAHRRHSSLFIPVVFSKVPPLNEDEDGDHYTTLVGEMVEAKKTAFLQFESGNGLEGIKDVFHLHEHMHEESEAGNLEGEGETTKSIRIQYSDSAIHS